MFIGDTLRKLFLVHGSRDDNVHLQHSMTLSKALVKEGVTFKQQVSTYCLIKLKQVRDEEFLNRSGSSIVIYVAITFSDLPRRHALHVDIADAFLPVHGELPHLVLRRSGTVG